MTFQTSDSSSLFADTSSLPKVTISARGGVPQLQAFVNAYIVGGQETLMNGNWARPLYYLSLVAMHGQGTTLQGIFARLVSTHSKDVSIEGIGDVALAHHQTSIANSGYTLHWNFEQEEVLPTHDVHAVIECRMLTMYDPLQGLSGARQQRGTTQERIGLAFNQQVEQGAQRSDGTPEPRAESTVPPDGSRSSAREPGVPSAFAFCFLGSTGSLATGSQLGGFLMEPRYQTEGD